MVGSGRKRMRKNVIPHKNLYHRNQDKDDSELDETDNRPFKVPRLAEDFYSASTSGSGIQLCPEKPSEQHSKIKDTAEVVQEIDRGAKKQTTLKNVAVLAKPHYRSRSTQTETQTKPPQVEQATSPIKILKKIVRAENLKPRCSLEFSSDTGEKQSSTSFASLSSTSKDSNDEISIELRQKICIQNITSNPKRYLGINKESLWIVAEIKKHTELDNIAIYLTLKKIKTAHTFGELADDFGITESTATRLFKNAIPLLSPLMKELIVWPPAEDIKRNLPTAFRARYGKVQSIIDCLEIEISKPSDPVKQALTWSEYKKANTIKYLISATPDGIINFISKGYSGRTTDQVIVEECGYLDILRPGMEIMADRGFKNIDKLLNDRQCRLVRPPSTKSGEKLSKEEVIQTKRIASLRIHIERVIRRLREYKFLKPHACIHSKLIPFTDHIVYISCGLINLQEPLIKVH